MATPDIASGNKESIDIFRQVDVYAAHHSLKPLTKYLISMVLSLTDLLKILIKPVINKDKRL